MDRNLTAASVGFVCSAGNKSGQWDGCLDLLNGFRAPIWITEISNSYFQDLEKLLKIINFPFDF